MKDDLKNAEKDVRNAFSNDKDNKKEDDSSKGIKDHLKDAERSVREAFKSDKDEKKEEDDKSIGHL